MTPTPGGILFKLPRPVRDKIYRVLVKGAYRLVGPSYWTSREVTDDELESKHNDIVLTILQVSSAKHREATVVLYYESTFNSHIDFEGDQVNYIPSQQALDRVMKVMVNVIVGLLLVYVKHTSDPSAHRAELQQMWETAIGNFAGTDRVRDNSMHVTFDVRTPDIEDADLRPMYRGLQTLAGFPHCFRRLCPPCSTWRE